MNWEVPSYEEIKMDAEIGSYQVDPEIPDGLVTPRLRGRDAVSRHAAATQNSVHVAS